MSLLVAAIGGFPVCALITCSALGNVPVGVVEAKRLYKLPADGLQQAMRYAEILHLPFAYASNGRGLVEHDFATGKQTNLHGLPNPDELWGRYRAARGIVDDTVAASLLLPFNRDLRNADGSVKEARYYQRIAIDMAAQGILSGKPRQLLNMATGTGKTFVALQVVWKLWESGWKGRRKPRARGRGLIQSSSCRNAPSSDSS